jgi:glycine/D-amino acid oxidase-like deaminating enzyme
VSLRVLEGSFWSGPPSDPQPPLEGDARADVAVIGGGLTGLSTALALREAGVDVALVERDFCGSGASGRNAGHLTPTIGKDLPTLLRLFGRTRASAFARFADRAVGRAEELIRRHAIACDYVASGNVLAGQHPAQRARLERAAETAARLGAKVAFLDESEVRRRGLPACVRFGVLEERGGTLDPGKLVRGLRAAALAAGARVYEGSEVRRISPGRAPRIATDGGSLRAERVVVATNAYTPATLGWLRLRVVPLRVLLFATEPLSDAARARLGWPGREGLYSAHEILESWRLTLDGRLVGGSRWVRYAYGSALADGASPRLLRRFAGLLGERFPGVDARIDAFWGGWIGSTLDFLPVFRTHGSHANLHSGLAFNGHGVAQACLFGSLLADAALGRENEDAELFTRRGIPLPPEPLRWLLARGVLGSLAIADALTDRAIRRSRP